jgi:hypothetical protein
MPDVDTAEWTAPPELVDFSIAIYSFSDESGLPREGRSSAALTLKSGAIVTVLYLGDHPKKSTIYPSLMAELA